MIRRFFTWPRTPENNLLPWPRIVWAFMWLPVYLAGALLATLAVLVTNGPAVASELWDDLKPG